MTTKSRLSQIRKTPLAIPPFVNNLLPNYRLLVTDLISAVVELLERDISRLVVEVREVLEPVKP
jgi:hypothetical protein